MSSRVIKVALVSSLAFVFLACSQGNQEVSLRHDYYEAVKSRDIDGALSSFSELYSQFPVSDEEAFEAAWLAFFCRSDVEVARTYFQAIENPKRVFHNIFHDLSVVHLGVWVICASESADECMNYSEDALEFASGFEESRDTYLSEYVDDIVYLEELSETGRVEDAMTEDRFLDFCRDAIAEESRSSKG